MVPPSEFLHLLKETYSEWIDDKAPRLGAALAYYTVFSLAPLLIILVAVVGAIWGNQSGLVQARILREVEGMVGTGGADLVKEMLTSSSHPDAGLLPTLLGVAGLLFGATTVFAQLQDALNTIWEVESTVGGVKGVVVTRLMSFALILLVGFLLLALLVISALLSALDSFVAGITPGMQFLFRLLDLLVSFGIITLLFAMIYRYLPDVEIGWRDVWTGAAVTAILFTLGKYALGAYMAHSSTGSAYGAAGSLAALFVWIYYSAQLVFFGAEFTQVYARRYGSRIQPADYAIHIREPLQDAAPEPHDAPPPSPFRWKRAFPVVLAFLAGRYFGRR